MSRLTGRSVGGRLRAGTAGAMLLLALASAAAQAKPIQAAKPVAMTFGGFTNYGWPVVLDVSANQRMLKVAAIGLDMNCGDSNTFSTRDSNVRIPIAPNGSFSLDTKLPPDPASGLLSG
jgi:hypothetical protein